MGISERRVWRTDIFRHQSDAGLNDTMFFGGDRLHFVEQALGSKNVTLPRLCNSRPLTLLRQKFRFFFDFSSPWSFLGWTQLHRLTALGDVELIPILLGALFKQVGTPNIPMLAVPEKKREWGSRDMLLWQQWWGEEVRFPDFFPIKSVTPLRVAIVEPKTIDTMYRAAWQQNINIANDKLLSDLLNTAGFDATDLIAQANSPRIKEQLTTNTSLAINCGVIGVPTFMVGDELVWGQDRIHWVCDLLCGWRVPDKSAFESSTTIQPRAASASHETLSSQLISKL